MRSTPTKLTLDITGVVSASDFPEVLILRLNNDNSAWLDVSSLVTSRNYPNIVISGLSSFGEFVTATPATLAAPVIQNTTVAGGAITLNWNAISGAGSYQILSSDTPDGRQKLNFWSICYVSQN